MKKVLLSLLMILTVTMFLTACGGDKSKLVEPVVEQENVVEEPKTGTDVDMSKLTIVTEDYPPTNYLDENGNLVGTATELVKQALVKLNLSTDIIKVYDWSKSYEMALNDENVLIYAIYRTEAREKLFKWIKPVSYGYVYMYKLKSNTDVKVSSLEDAKKYKISTLSEDFTEQELLKKGFEMDKNIISSPSQKASIENVFDKKADIFLAATDDASIAKVLESTGHKAEEMEKIYTVNELTSVGYIAASLKTSDEMIEKFKAAMPDIEVK
ncbi:MAG TPA: hypothetical protein DEP72_06975 [Clostridiales bacterium]|nr:MAG: hypothetical protein A2Y18_07920 [Clostridiales bacterium GWD2_32_19]HCC07883.1 hypothetical protein [Clostridiales bacterium]